MSIDTVARQVGVTGPVVYGPFTDSNQLLRASPDRENQAALAQVGKVLRQAEASEPAERIPTLASGFLDAALAAPQRWSAIIVVLVDVRPVGDLARALASSAYHYLVVFDKLPAQHTALSQFVRETSQLASETCGDP